MYRDCVITVISDLSFHGKVLIRYLENETDEVSIKFTLNKDNSITGTTESPSNFNINNLNFNTIDDLKEYLRKIKDMIYLIQVA